MKIGIVSDTHICKDTEKLTDFLNGHFKNIDAIIHAGDYKSSDVVDILSKYKNFIGVWGNVDVESRFSD